MLRDMSPEIEKLIKIATEGGQITEKQREIIYRKAKEQNIDEMEVDIIIESILAHTKVPDTESGPKVYAVSSSLPKEEKTILKKRLCRDTENGKISGVCAGLAKYFNCSVSTVRVVFVIGFILFFLSFYLYIPLAIFLPKEDDLSI